KGISLNPVVRETFVGYHPRVKRKALKSTVKHFVTLALIALCCVYTTYGQSGFQKQSTPDLQIIDAHTHTDFSGGPERTSRIQKTEAQYFKEWQEAGVVGAVAHVSPVGANFHDLKSRNVVYCAGVGLTIDAAGIEAGLKSGKYGCIKIYLGYVHRYAYDPTYTRLYRLAEKYDVPVVYHTGDTYSPRAKVKYADPLTIDEVAVDHPRVNFVIAHCGNPWIESAAEVTYKNANVYMECSAMLIGNMDEMPKEKVETYVTKPIAWVFGYLEDPRKLMFGTDWPLTSMKPYLEAYKRAIPQEHWKAVFHDNAVRVFKLRGWKELK
ncbi:MAG TPA: amidohydrolase family protein, partial [Pyrinomonadaceae bacterium]|nr:amidohydrolase family protein [Pyrinomonadaceae bacterium]